MSKAILIGDLHLEATISKYVETNVGGNPTGYEESSINVHRVLLEEVKAQKLPTVHTGDAAVNVLSVANQALYREIYGELQATLGDAWINAMGNHDNQAEQADTVPADIRAMLTIFDYGYKNTFPLWRHIVVDNISFIVLHNIQDSFSTQWDYANVNPAGGYANQDWGGIATPASPQRQFLTTALADAATNKRHVIVLGHRAVYSLTPIASRPNHAEAVQTNGYVQQLEDWAVANQQNVILLTGDVHSVVLTEPVYRGAKNRYGVVHLTLSTGPGLRGLNAAIQPYHRGHAYASGVSVPPTAPVHTFPVNVSWLNSGMQFPVYATIEYGSHKATLSLYLVIAPWARAKLPADSKVKTSARTILLDRFSMDVSKGKMSGPLSRCVPCGTPLLV